MKKNIKTDCRTEIGITVGLIDSLISICRIIVTRELKATEIREALDDLRSDVDVHTVVQSHMTPEDRKMLDTLHGANKLLQQRIINN